MRICNGETVHYGHQAIDFIGIVSIYEQCGHEKLSTVKRYTTGTLIITPLESYPR